MTAKPTWIHALVAVALVLVFLAYLQPEFALTAVNWISSCF
jgi:hypothetical protein